ncbi:unnamed protein product [Coccothraustes coccothraustes]
MFFYSCFLRQRKKISQCQQSACDGPQRLSKSKSLSESVKCVTLVSHCVLYLSIEKSFQQKTQAVKHIKVLFVMYKISLRPTLY